VPAPAPPVAGAAGVVVAGAAGVTEDEVEAPDVAVPPLAADAAEPVSVDPVGEVVEVLVVCVVVLPVLVLLDALAATVAVGTVNAGTSALSDEFELLPQAARPTASATPAIRAAMNIEVRERLRAGIGLSSGTRSRVDPSAGRSAGSR
jgi:hypothetical protein